MKFTNGQPVVRPADVARVTTSPTPLTRMAPAVVVGAIACALLLGPVLAAVLFGSAPAEPAVTRGWMEFVAEPDWTDPAQSFWPQSVPRPGPVLFWSATAAVLAASGSAGTLAARRLDRLLAEPTLARNRLSPRGAAPRSWARPRDLRQLRVRHRVASRLTAGTIGRPAQLLAIAEETNTLLVAPSRSGKTSRFAIPWTLEAPGPCISLSVKTDVYRLTAHARARKGNVWLWDPFGEQSTQWSALHGCDSWSVALKRAAHLADAGGKGRDSEAAMFWNAEGAKLIAPLLHAAALSEGDMRRVLGWLDERCEDEPLEILDAAEADAAAAQLQAVVGLDPRNAGTTYMSAASLLEAYRHPAVQQTDSNKGFSAERFLDGEAHTLYVVAGPDDQQLLAPIVVAMLNDVLATAFDRFTATGTPLNPRLRVVGDELPNIAPIRSLPRYAATLLDAGVRLITIAQDVAQLEVSYGKSADTILSNSQAKLFLGPVHDSRTRRYITDLLGDEPVITRARGTGKHPRQETTNWRPRATPQLLQQLADRRALLIHGNLPAAVIQTQPWWEIPGVREECELSLQKVGNCSQTPYSSARNGGGVRAAQGG